MTTERHDAPPRATRLQAVPTPRAGVPTVGFGVSAIAEQEDAPRTDLTAEPGRRSRSLTAVVVFLVLVAIAAGVVVFRVVVPSTPSAQAVVTADDDQVREQPGTIVRYGDPHKYGDGLEVAVNPPQRYEPSRNATGVESGIPVRVQIVITNRTDEAFRPNTLVATATSGGQEAVEIWDPDQGIALTGPDVTVPPGATVHFYLAFSVADPGNTTVEVTPALYGYGATVVRNG